MSHYDQQYNAIIQKIIESGISDEEYQVRGRSGIQTERRLIR